jgi:hypothetical protein
MKKLSLLVGALGGTFAGYLFSNQQLRTQLAKAKDPEAAAKILGKHLSRDGKKIAKEVQEFVKSDEVQKNLGKARRYAEDVFVQAKRDVGSLVGSGAKSAKLAAKRGVGKARKAAKRMKLKVRRIA